MENCWRITEVDDHELVGLCAARGEQRAGFIQDT
jgi:hypothetical protein